MSTTCSPMRASGVREFNWLRVIGDAPGKGAILSFEAEGMHAHDLATILDREGVAVRAGHHCAQPLMERFGVASTTRASFALYNTRGEVDVLIAALAQGAKDFGLDDGRFAARALPGSDPRSLAASAPFRHAGRTPRTRAKGYNPLCGDRVKVYLVVDERRPHRRHHVRRQGLRHQPGVRLADDRHAGRPHGRGSRKADGRLPASGERRGRATASTPTTASGWKSWPASRRFPCA